MHRRDIIKRQPRRMSGVAVFFLRLDSSEKAYRAVKADRTGAHLCRRTPMREEIYVSDAAVAACAGDFNFSQTVRNTVITA